MQASAELYSFVTSYKMIEVYIQELSVDLKTGNVRQKSYGDGESFHIGGRYEEAARDQGDR